MGLAALICAYHDAAAPEESLRATLPLAGRTLVERQARLAASAGAHPVVILVERMPGALTAAIDRMRSEGISAVVARTVDEAAEAVHPDDRLLVMADGVVADPVHVSRLLAAEGTTVLTVPDQGVDDRYERIDAQSRWAGLAVLDGELLRLTASRLQDWDLQSTLLRRAIQGGARQFALRTDMGDIHLTVAEKPSDLIEVETRIVEGAAGARDDWPSRYLLAPFERSITGWLMPTSATPDWLYILAAAMTGLAAFLFAGDWLWIGGAFLLAATPIDGVAERLAALRMQPTGGRSWARSALPWLAGAALGALGYALSKTAGWGALTLPAATIAFLHALRREQGDREVEGKTFLAERKGMTWAMVPFAVGGSWVAGLGALAAYAAGSFFWVQHKVHAKEPVPLRQDQPPL